MALETLKPYDVIGGFEVAHLPKAISKEEYLELIKNKFIIIGEENNTIAVKLQNGPIGENGVNGVQVDTLIHIVKAIIGGLNEKFSNKYNAGAIDGLALAINSLEARTKDRETRGVEGKSEA